MQVIGLNNLRANIVHQQTQIASSGAETTILSTGGTGVFHDIISLIVTNASATATSVTIKDSTAGTTRIILDLGALGSNSAIPLIFPTPVNQSVANNNWTATLSSAVVTVNFFVQAVRNT